MAGRGFLPNLQCCTKKELTTFFENIYDLEDVLFASIVDQKHFYCIPNKLRLPLIFYYGHSPGLYINKLLLAGVIKERVNFHFETLFEKGVDEMSWDDVDNYRLGGSFDWPSVEEVCDYRIKVRKVVRNVIETSSLPLPITKSNPWWSLIMAIEHQRIHVETTSVLLRQLPVDYICKPVTWTYAEDSSGSHVVNDFVQMPAGTVTLGKFESQFFYSWDVDYGKLQVNVPPFEVTKYKITNAEFLKFVDDGGYSRKELWTTTGWCWVNTWSVAHPVFWVCSKQCRSVCGGFYSHCNIPETGNECFKYRALFDVIDMPWDWPVEVNFHEARAYCEWKGSNCRLITEAEHCLLSSKDVVGDRATIYSWSEHVKGNIGAVHGSPTSVNKFPPNDFGIYDVYGNVWEWTADHLNGLPGYKSHYLYEDYSWPYFDGKHMMMVGGSWITTGYNTLPYTRNFFRPHFHQHSGFRVVRSLTSEPVPVKYIKGSEEEILSTLGGVSETSFQLSMSAHYIYEDKEIVKKFVEKFGSSQKYFSILCDLLRKLNSNTNRCLVLCCGIGVLSCHLSTLFEQVIGIDYSNTLISVAEKLLNDGCVTLNNKPVLHLPNEMQKENVEFKQLTCLYNECKDFDAVIFEQLDRLIEPKGWLLKIKECVVKNGLVIFITQPSKKLYLMNTLGSWFSERMEVSVNEEEIISVWQTN